MSMRGMDIFDTTVQKTMAWLKQIDIEIGWHSRRRSYDALRCCLHQVRDHLGVNEMAHLAAQLPMLVRGIYFEGWDPSHAPLGRSADDFIQALSEAVGWQIDYDNEAIARACFTTMASHLDEGIVRHVTGCLPDGIRCYWPSKRAWE